MIERYCPISGFQDWFPTGDVCYLIDRHALEDWTTAYAQCKKKGGYLAWVDTEEVADAISSKMRGADLPLVWIGLRRKRKKFVYRMWIKIETVSFVS